MKKINLEEVRDFIDVQTLESKIYIAVSYTHLTLPTKRIV